MHRCGTRTKPVALPSARRSMSADRRLMAEKSVRCIPMSLHRHAVVDILSVHQSSERKAKKTPPNRSSRRQSRAAERRQPADREGRRRFPGAGLHRGHAGLETRAGRRLDARITRTVPGVRRRTNGTRHLRHGGPRLVPELPLLHAHLKVAFFRGAGAPSRSARRVQGQERALPRHPRGRPDRRGAACGLGEAGQPTARLAAPEQSGQSHRLT